MYKPSTFITTKIIELRELWIMISNPLLHGGQKITARHYLMCLVANVSIGHQ